ncbi:MFS transporter [Paraburkholderia fungorum]|uniref:MFS transporter n=1 Tax=Paraburkholderia fungorum TaxID=134537 RepID=A0A420FEU0_9BURK|nr:MFS transporter [Paraburkholderia fungorum]RKF31487.1 MFS transporter [Paraburkholderia fungorum]
MDTTSVSRSFASSSSARASTRAGFFSFGLFLSAWAPLAPLAKLRLHLSDSHFGLALLCFGLGCLVAMPVGTALAARFGCRKVILSAGPVVCACLYLLATTENPAVLVASLLVFGSGLGVTESAMNLQSAVVQRSHDEPLMSGFHAWFSIGCIAGATGVSALLSAGLSAEFAVGCISAILVFIWSYYGKNFLAATSKGSTFALALPKGRVLWIGALCFISFLAEGAMLDWSGVFLTTVKNFDPSRAGYGYACFAVAMTAGRLSGDFLSRSLQPRNVLWAGALLAALGIASLVASNHWLLLMLSFAFVGFGLANIVPSLFLVVARQHVMPIAVAMPVVATIGYAGMLTGPAFLGNIAEHASLQTAFLTVAAMLFVIVATAKVAD